LKGAGGGPPPAIGSPDCEPEFEGHDFPRRAGPPPPPGPPCKRSKFTLLFFAKILLNLLLTETPAPKLQIKASTTRNDTFLVKNNAKMMFQLQKLNINKIYHHQSGLDLVQTVILVTLKVTKVRQGLEMDLHQILVLLAPKVRFC